MSGRPVLFLDRDGTLNVDKSYINSLDMLELIPGTAEALQMACKAGFALSIITNQQGIAKGLTPPDMPEKILRSIAKDCAVTFDDHRVCPHRQEENCGCRKPQPGNLKASIAFLNADLARSWYVGDHVRDMELARNCGINAILVRTGHGATTEKELAAHPDLKPAFVAPDLLAAVRWILSQRN